MMTSTPVAPFTIGDPPPGCTCGTYLSILPPDPPTNAWSGPPIPVFRSSWMCVRCQRVNAPHVDQCPCTPGDPAGALSW